MSERIALTDLNAEQRDVVTTLEGPVLVLAGAGTGKTRAVTYRIAHLLNNKGVPAQNILAVTFTNKAAHEMKDRVVRLVGKKQASGLTMCTFHSLCVRILRENAAQAGLGKAFTIYDERDQASLIRAALREKRVADKGIDPSVLLYRISNAKADLVEPEGFVDDSKDKYGEIAAPTYAAYQELLKARNAVDFDDLIMKTVTLFRRHQDVLHKYHERFRYIMVDEFQDTSRSQYVLVELLAKGHRNICVVGDDDQSIYGWRGAHASNIKDFKRGFKGTKVVKLEENYRSTGNILAVANHIISKNKGRMEKRLWTRRHEGSKVDLVVAQNEIDEAETVVANVIAFHERHNMEYRNAAVLYRSNVQSRIYEEELRKRRVPYRLLGGQGFYDRKEIRDMVAYLKVIHNDKDEMSMLRIVNVPPRGIGETTLARIVETAHQEGMAVMDLFGSSRLKDMASPEAIEAIHKFLGLMDQTRKRFQEEPIDQAFKSLVEDIRYEQDLRRCTKSEEEFLRRWENVQEMVNSLAAQVKDDRTSTLGKYLDRVSLISKDDKPDYNGPDNAVTLMTIHSAKGLEFPVVFLIGVEEDLLPHARSMADGKDALSEERRLCYVAVTRAQKYLAICRAETRRRYGKAGKCTASRFLNGIPEELLRERCGVAGPSEKPSRSRRKSAKSVGRAT